jgi:hypothetical protein
LLLKFKFDEAVAAFVVPSDKIILFCPELFIVENPVPLVPDEPDVPEEPALPELPLAPDVPEEPELPD